MLQKGSRPERAALPTTGRRAEDISQKRGYGPKNAPGDRNQPATPDPLIRSPIQTESIGGRQRKAGQDTRGIRRELSALHLGQRLDARDIFSMKLQKIPQIGVTLKVQRHRESDHRW